jgi:hypothetical protein
MIGTLPPSEGWKVYMDPHWSYGCEVVLDISISLVNQLCEVPFYMMSPEDQ